MEKEEMQFILENNILNTNFDHKPIKYFNQLYN